MKKNEFNNKIFSWIGISLGVLSLVFAVIMKLTYFEGNYVRKETYGGDAYTGMQNASAATANNLLWLHETIYIGFLLTFILVGLYLIFKHSKELILLNYNKQKDIETVEKEQISQ